MRYPRRRRKTYLTLLAVALCAGVWLVQSRRHRGEEYSAGQRAEGIVDELARDVPENTPRVRFENVAAESGLDFRHFPGTRSNRLPEDMGSGVALGDVNGDGWTDAFLVNVAHALGEPAPTDGSGRCRLFLGSEGGHFRDATDASGIDLAFFGNGASLVDVDSDGDLDLFVAGYGRCYLFANDGNAHFKDISQRAGVSGFDGFWTSVGVADFDRDGIMDLYVCGYVVYDEGAVSSGATSSQYDKVIPALINPSTFEPERNLLLRGLGNGHFEEVGEAMGVSNPTGRSLGVLFTDIDGDGWADLYVANDVSDNALFLGRGGTAFEDVTTESLVGDYRGAMGLAAADFDADGDTDLFVTHWIGQENALYVQKSRAFREGDEPGPPIFMDGAARSGLGSTALDRVGWATRFFDYDNDGWLDLFVVNGHTIPLAQAPTQMRPMRSQLFWHVPGERNSFFHGVGAVSGEFF
ncbi:MAG: VCBS repeat-containing protein, partial [Planctomycetes bacterium]|nr:VCBS repeat-containing protein [Planctomycetota bacterium]